MSAPIGEVRVDVRGDTSKVEPDIEKGLKKASADLDDDLNRIGQDFGNTISNSMEKEFHKHGPAFSKSIEKGIGKNIPLIPWDLDTDRDTVARSVTRLGEGIEKEVRKLSSGGGAGGGGGPFGALRNAIADAIGAGFNISGKSPLILFLIPLVGAIAELVVGAIQAINALSAALFVLPGLIAAIVFQVGTLFIAFQGVGTAIQGAFAAKNADELKKALEGLSPAAQGFVKSLLPLKDLFATIKATVQEGFFITFGNSITAVAKTLGPVLVNQLGPLAAALGAVARTLVTFFADPAFRYFVALIIPATVKWLDSFGPALYKFLFGLTQIGIYLTPFFEWVGSSLVSSLASLGDWLNRLSSDPEFLAWLERMKVTFGEIGKVIDAAAFFVFALVRAVDRAGGDKILQDIADQLNAIATFLSTDIGTKSIEGLIHIIQFLAYSFTILLLGILAVSAAFELILEFLRHGVAPWLANFFSNTLPEFFEKVGQAILDFFSLVGEAVINYTKALGQAFLDLGAFILETLFNIGGWVTTHVAKWVSAVFDFFTAIPREFWRVITDLWDQAFEAGRTLLSRLIQGIKSMFSPLGGVMGEAAQIVKDHWPFSPAKEGPLSGQGDPLLAGQRIIDRLATGIAMESPELSAASNTAMSSIVFGPNSIQATFNGQLPTNNQAMALGGALGGGIANQLAVRDTRLAVRAMA